MFEHMKNYEALMRKIASWLKPNRQAAGGEALVFIHYFCHRSTPYHYVEDDGWMAKSFFTGPLRPTFSVLHRVVHQAPCKAVQCLLMTCWSVPLSYLSSAPV